ncbi:uncharacterized protein [Solanum lycopersicum]|uniref:uncharacterized protein n=1 Tax=Solanum lycopersicum TaxID=4081 RepID=UPI0037484CF7
MDISRLMVHAEKIEENTHKQVGRELNMVKTEEGNSFKNRFDDQEIPRFKRRSSNQVPPNAPRINKSKVSTPMVQEGKGDVSYVEKPLCSKCGRKHDGRFQVYTSNHYGCGKRGHMKRHFPNMNTQRRKNSQAQASSPNIDDPMKNHFYALQYRGDRTISLDVVTDSGTTLSFVTPLVTMKFDILPDILEEPFYVSSLYGDSMVGNRIYNGCSFLLAQ